MKDLPVKALANSVIALKVSPDRKTFTVKKNRVTGVINQEEHISSLKHVLLQGCEKDEKVT
jgi:hypothetical protein